MYRIEDNVLTTDDGTISFDKKIWEVAELAGVMIVLLDLTGQKDDINNIYGVKNCQIIWRVQDAREYNPGILDPDSDGFPILKHCPYTHIEIYEKDLALLIGTVFNGFRYLIDPSNGKIVGEESWVK